MIPNIHTLKIAVMIVQWTIQVVYSIFEPEGTSTGMMMDDHIRCGKCRGRFLELDSI